MSFVHSSCCGLKLLGRGGEILSLGFERVGVREKKLLWLLTVVVCV